MALFWGKPDIYRNKKQVSNRFNRKGSNIQNYYKLFEFLRFHHEIRFLTSENIYFIHYKTCVVILISILLNRNLQRGRVKLALWKERL